MSITCRTCAEPIYHLNPRDLFKQENEDIRYNIHAITGIKVSRLMMLCWRAYNFQSVLFLVVL